MPWPALLTVHAAALLHAGWNLVAKKAGGGNHFVRRDVGAGSLWVALVALGRLGTVALLGERLSLASAAGAAGVVGCVFRGKDRQPSPCPERGFAARGDGASDAHPRSDEGAGAVAGADARPTQGPGTDPASKPAGQVH
jgi:hypothetical protein